MFGVKTSFEDVVMLKEMVRKMGAKGVPESILGYVGGRGNGFQKAVVDGWPRER